MNEFAVSIGIFFGILRPAIFVAGVLVAVAAVLSWSVRTRKISPFSPVARFVRRIDGPLFGPMERRVVRMGGLPSSAPWWMLAAVVIGGLILLSVLQFLFTEIFLITAAVGGQGGPPIGVILIRYGFGFLKIAIMARVISSWVGGGPYSKWWRWSYVSTEWLLGPLRRVIPTIGPIDISPLVAYFGLTLLQSALLGALY